jgi:hypothetical protein
VVGNITNLGSGRFRLSAGKTYSLKAVWAPVDTSDEFGRIQWYNVTTSSHFGTEGNGGDPTNSHSTGAPATAIITPTVDTDVEVRMTSDNATGSDFTRNWMEIVQLGTTASTGVAFNVLTNAIATGTLDNTNYAQTWNWSTATTQTGLTMGFDALTSGNGLAISSTSTSASGNLFSVTSATTGNATNGLVRFNFTGAHTGNAVQIDTATSTGKALVINATSMTTGQGIDLNLGSSFTGQGINIDGNIGNGSGIRVNVNGGANNTYGIESVVTSTGSQSRAGYFANNSASRTSNQILYVEGTGNNTDIVTFVDSTNTCTGNPGATMVFTCSSDERLKHNIVDAEAVLGSLNQLQIRAFDWNSDGTHERYGVIAQEVENTGLSWLVTTRTDGYKSVREIDPLMLVKGIQELNAKVEDFKTAQNIINASTNGSLSTVDVNIESLNDRVAEIESALAGSGSTFTANALAGLTSDSTTITASLPVSILQSLTIGGALTVSGDANFLGNLSVAGNLQVGSNTAGTATIPQGEVRVHVTFALPHTRVPVVNITPDNPISGSYYRKNVTVNGFDIVLTQAQAYDLKFDWTAFEK